MTWLSLLDLKGYLLQMWGCVSEQYLDVFVQRGKNGIGVDGLFAGADRSEANDKIFFLSGILYALLGSKLLLNNTDAA